MIRTIVSTDFFSMFPLDLHSRYSFFNVRFDWSVILTALDMSDRTHYPLPIIQQAVNLFLLRRCRRTRSCLRGALMRRGKSTGKNNFRLHVSGNGEIRGKSHRTGALRMLAALRRGDRSPPPKKKDMTYNLFLPESFLFGEMPRGAWGCPRGHRLSLMVEVIQGAYANFDPS